MEKNLVEWSEKYSVGFNEIDSQHQKLIEMINTLYKSFKQGVANETIEIILNEMLRYTDYHFKTEEKYFFRYQFSNTQKHINEHLDFVEQVTEFFNDFRDGSVTLSYDIMDFLREWLINHILGSDKLFAEEFRKKNITKLD